MLKNLDKKLLHHFPLLWNLKFPYIILAGIVFHILAYFGSYFFSDFDIKSLRDFHSNNVEDIIIGFFAVFGGIILIVWFLFYIRNNGLKAFYPKDKNAIFKEWLLVFCILLLFLSAIFTIQKGIKDKAISLFSKEEFSKRVETVYKAGFFIDYPIERQVDSTSMNPTDSVYLDSYFFRYRGKDFPWTSLIARHQRDVFEVNEDSLYTVQTRNLLYNNDSVVVKKLMKDYLQIHKEHRLETNLTAEKWFRAVYKAPFFDDYYAIQPYISGDEVYYTDNIYLGKKSKYFVEQNELFDYYRRMMSEQEKEIWDEEIIVALFYFAFACSLVVLVFRISSLLHWFLSVVILFLLVIFDFTVSEFFRESSLRYSSFILAVILELIVVILLAFVFTRNKKLSSVALNVFLMSFGFVIPLLFALVSELLERYYDQVLVILNFRDEYYGNDDSILDVAILNTGIIFLGMFLMCRYIRNWKALPEN